MGLSKKVASIGSGCVACGSCVKPCPTGAMSIYKGVYAVADLSTCVGCGKCAAVCPAGIIDIVKREAESA